ncbi:hypothetical protein RX717_00275 [Intestinibacillus sp. NTUH-41-i26]|nr:hypothetical protein [Intestinibacillus sp. NTUH-41-i26]WOC75469.1 hypothetical protein RX717_00275 [Intestinibacillus sp. NTUH-41-i26]
MSFSDHKITAFQHKITDLPDQPSLPANELKARFDSSPEELRQAVNGICDEASRLEARVEGIVVDTFGDTIDREMLSEELSAELDAKATQAALTSETTALKNRVSSLEQAMPKRAQVIYGTYTGDGTENRLISLGFKPYLVILAPTIGNFEMLETITVCHRLCGGSPPELSESHLTENGFRVSESDSMSINRSNNPNESGKTYGYIAFGL